ncbi:hypothetical protein HNP46_000312 [Pseudomonas nitritireducens]|uniref:Uncharacterized protein n=1 Tax=Pseudomonas nitroreducens TaxID=46680 RepID=A0A7W7NYI8_PSENT|nr:hypothetical protein [Pseudomonas nitritireducens]MBB4861501.1 hypothetical protein [Pseudomonas nitritireducens]
MTSSEELQALIGRAQALGAKVYCQYDMDTLRSEGRYIVTSIQVTGLPGCGPNPMPPIAAAERLRELTSRSKMH